MIILSRLAGRWGQENEYGISPLEIFSCPHFPALSVMRESFKESLGNDVVNDAAMHVGQAEVATAVAIRETFVIETDQVQNRGV